MLITCDFSTTEANASLFVNDRNTPFVIIFLFVEYTLFSAPFPFAYHQNGIVRCTCLALNRPLTQSPLYMSFVCFYLQRGIHAMRMAAPLAERVPSEFTSSLYAQWKRCPNICRELTQTTRASVVSATTSTRAREPSRITARPSTTPTQAQFNVVNAPRHSREHITETDTSESAQYIYINK